MDDSKPPSFGDWMPNVPKGERGTPRICYHAAEAIYHMMGGKDAGLTPMHIYHEGFSHWYLRWETCAGTLYIDPTAGQFRTLPDYEQGTGKGFMTGQPSHIAQRLRSQGS